MNVKKNILSKYQTYPEAKSLLLGEPNPTAPTKIISQSNISIMLQSFSFPSFVAREREQKIKGRNRSHLRSILLWNIVGKVCNNHRLIVTKNPPAPEQERRRGHRHYVPHAEHLFRHQRQPPHSPLHPLRQEDEALRVPGKYLHYIQS